MIPYEQGYRKVGFKARRGRHVSKPVAHGRRRHRSYSRAARRFKHALMLRFAPTVEEQLLEQTRPVASGVHVSRQVALGAIGLASSYKEAPRAVPAAGERDPKEQYLR